MPSSSNSAGSGLLLGEKTVMEGEVLRRSLFSTWRKMYMVLKDDGVLFQYPNNPQFYPEVSLKESLVLNNSSVIQVINAEKITHQNFTILLFLTNKAPVLLKAKDGVEHQRWVTSLTRYAEKYKSNSFIQDSISTIPTPSLVIGKDERIKFVNNKGQSIFTNAKFGTNIKSVLSYDPDSNSQSLGAIPFEVRILKTASINNDILMLASKIELDQQFVFFFHDVSEYDYYLDEELEEVFDEVYQAQMNGTPETVDDSNQTMRLFVKILGMSPFVLKLHHGLQTHHYQKIVNMYYSDKLYNKKPPGPIYLQKIINFKNGDKLMEFSRKQAAADKFNMESQVKTPIYDEPPACDDSIVMQKSSVPDLFNGDVPKVIDINRLIILLTDAYSPQFLSDVFWYTFRYSMKPKIVLDKIYQRYFVPELTEQDLLFNDVERSFFSNVVAVGIKKKCLLLILKFVKSGMFDFDNDMVNSLDAFIRTAFESLNVNPSSNIITNLDLGISSTITHIKELMAKQDRKQPWQKAKDMDKIFNIKENKKAKFVGGGTQGIDLSELTPKEIAEQLTYMDYALYNEIHFTEILDQAWNKDKRRHQAPHVMLNINFLNKVSTWLSVKILTEEDPQKRVRFGKKIMQVLGILKEMNSYNMLMAIIGALGSTPVHRLSKVWDEMDEKLNEVQNACNELSSPKGNSKNFRMAMNECFTNGKPCCPYIGIYLRDLVFTDDGNPTIMDGKINFSKCINTYNVMYQILRFQGRPYEIEPNNDFIKEMISFNEKERSEEELYELSLQIQPRK
ncbi:rasGEF domain-containing protein [Naegleria gruberi]|uniref:RasGEF domain-containing protein n=1 Tax=Naegleria gruberi TaxID=5762 RepID=D2V7F5_NAEGR|nr:rasGEF domain-containing protein [Naegleria gruberi]EFC47370.1 rasGEF domain-containing protein [Naegleria gruberi]|eukprot:XP_002680114.1 rasGEF domain-containing protein [Naegleria gruberi strain NEG-M]